jgi:chromosome segregation ATPase
MHVVNGGTGMTLQDYELLITTMEEIASLDRNVKDLEGKITRANIQIGMDEAKVRTFTTNLSILKSAKDPGKEEPEIANPKLEKINTSIASGKSEKINTSIASGKSEKKELDGVLKEHETQIEQIKNRFPVWLSPELEVSWKKSYIWQVYLFSAMFFAISALLIAETWPNLIPDIGVTCTTSMVENASYEDLDDCQANENAFMLCVWLTMIAWIIYPFYIWKRRSKIRDNFESELVIPRVNKNKIFRRIESITDKIDNNLFNLKKISLEHQHQKQEFKKEFNKRQKEFNKRQKEYKKVLNDIRSVEGSITKLSQKIDSGKQEVIENQSKKDKAQERIISALESVAHLTPHSSKL